LGAALRRVVGCRLSVGRAERTTLNGKTDNRQRGEAAKTHDNKKGAVARAFAVLR
jgi:hypothetical protein